jgi:phospholipid N-methyltransferase
VYTLNFMKEVIRTNKSTGALAPSSRALADAVTDMANLKGRKVIVEYGPGNGVFTEVILQKKDPDAFFIAMEVNPEFVKLTQQRCPGCHVVEDSASNTLKYLQEAGHEHCDVIISGLPWTRFEEPLQDEILEATFNALRPGGHFVTFAYSFSPHLPSGRRFFKDKLPLKFARIARSKPIWNNFPPAVVFQAEKA